MDKTRERKKKRIKRRAWMWSQLHQVCNTYFCPLTIELFIVLVSYANNFPCSQSFIFKNHSLNVISIENKNKLFLELFFLLLQEQTKTSNIWPAIHLLMSNMSS